MKIQCNIILIIKNDDNKYQLSTQLSYVGIIYLILMNASYPPVCYRSYKVSAIKSPKFNLLR